MFTYMPKVQICRPVDLTSSGLYVQFSGSVVAAIGYIYFPAYIHLRFKQAVLGTHLSYEGCQSRTIGRFS